MEDDQYGKMFETAWEDPVFLPTSTQTKRVEVTILSDEAAYRTKTQPCIKERIVQQKQWAQEQLERAKAQQQAEAMKLKQALLLKKLITDTDEQNLAELAKLEEEVEVINELDQQELNEEMRAQVNKNINYGEQIMRIKERKLTISRSTAEHHQYLPLKERRWAAVKLCLGWSTPLGKYNDMTEILPWLLLGTREIAMNLQEMLRHNVTHILNMSGDLPNFFPQHFVYQKVNIRDSVEEDIGKHFQTIVKYIKRCEDSKGRMFVHCTAGASRAPTAILAFLVYHRNVPLVDAYRFVQALRPVVKPNTHFLFQLAMLEVQLSQECSVYYHPDWRFFEFNTFRAEGVPARTRWGLFSTAMKLWAPVNVAIDMLEDNEKGGMDQLDD